MARAFFTMDDFDLSGRTVLLRVDINSPIDPATKSLLNDARLREHLSTIRDLRAAKVVVLAHQSRPGKDDFTSLEPHAERLSSLLGRPVKFVDGLYNKAALDAIRSLAVGEVLVLENVRFFAEEEALADQKIEKMAKTHIVKKLAPLAQYFVLDAFAAAHRAQPSLVGFVDTLPTLAGRVMEKELTMLDRAIHSQDRPKIAIFGGVKADDSIAVSQHMLEKGIVDKVLTTGGVANMFLQADGKDPGPPTTEFMKKEVEEYETYVAQCKELLAKHRDRVLLPTDVVVNDGGKRKPLSVKDLPSDLQVYDIGLDTIARYVEEINAAKTVFFNGPAGVFEKEEFSIGTRELLNALAESNAFTVAGGGHTVAAIEQYGLEDALDHVSTGGGALINYLAGKELPLVAALERSYKKFSAKKA
jgi:phosphoglycerate kinase